MEKRSPNPGEAAITHITADTGDRASFAIACFDPGVLAWLSAAVVRRLATDRDEAIDAGLMTIRLTGNLSFSVSGPTGPLTMNRVTIDGRNIELTTELLPSAIAATPNDLMMAADCEQCAAIALAFLDRSN